MIRCKSHFLKTRLRRQICTVSSTLSSVVCFNQFFCLISMEKPYKRSTFPCHFLPTPELGLIRERTNISGKKGLSFQNIRPMWGSVFLKKDPRGGVSSIIQMKSTDIQNELKNYKIREGFLLKRSRVLREWRKRWIVLTMNSLFSFEDQTCSKPTQIVDLKQIVSLRTILKSDEETEPNCFYIQTKSTDFPFSATELCQRWSWIVTLQRLFDFKEKGASCYNNIDMIKSQGFQSQNQYLFDQKIRTKTWSRNGKTIGLQEEERRKQMRAEELLAQLKHKQEELKKREERLEQQQKVLAKMRISNANFTNQIKELNLQIRQLQEESTYLKEEAFTQQRNFLLRESETVTKSIEETVQPEAMSLNTILQKEGTVVSEDHLRAKQKTIKYLFQHFHDVSDGLELVFIIDFFLKISEKEEYQYRPIIEKEIRQTKYLEFFLNVFLYVIKLKYEKSLNSLPRSLIFLKIVFRNQEQIEEKHRQEALGTVLEWSSQFNEQTSAQVVEDTLQILNLLEKESNQAQQQMEKTKKYLAALIEPSGQKETQAVEMEKTPEEG